MKININNEYGTLTDVLVASIETYFHHDAINANQEYYLKTSPPSIEMLVSQQRDFLNILSANGINLIYAEKQLDCPDQINTRDVAFAIGNKFIVSSMKEPLRRNEKKGIQTLISSVETPVYYVNSGVLEGGDILVDGFHIYVGISRRTDQAGIVHLSHILGEQYSIIEIHLKQGFLHLDTVFNIVGPRMALICSEAIEPASLAIIRERFDIIDITLEEQLHLGTNVLCIGNNTLVSQVQNKRINNTLSNHGFNIIETDYSEISKLGGAFRCGTCPLVRID